MSVLNPVHYATAARDLTRLLGRHRQLTWEMAKRDITDRYTGQVFGTLWAIGHPLALMGIYTIVFSFVFRQRAGGSWDLPLKYPAYLLSGLIPWMAFQESMAKSTVSVTSNANLVKQVVFPIEVLPVKGVLGSMITQAIALTLLLAYIPLAHNGLIHWTFALIPVLVVLQILAMIGVGYFLAAVGVYFRDVKDFVQVFCIAGMYIMPVFYLPEWVPDYLIYDRRIRTRWWDHILSDREVLAGGFCDEDWTP